MDASFYSGRINIILGDITSLESVAIFNSANTTLEFGAYGATRCAARQTPLNKCKRLGGYGTDWFKKKTYLIEFISFS